MTYTCTVTTGLRIDLCSIIDGSTESNFDPTTATYFFTSTDMQNFEPGTYTFTFSGTVGSQSDSATWDLILVDPCPEYDF